LTDVTFCREGNPSHRASPRSPDKKLLNFNKYHKLARIVQGKPFSYAPRLLQIRYLRTRPDMQRFQKPYNLKEIPEVQAYLNVAFENSKHHGDLQDLYRRRYTSNLIFNIPFLLTYGISVCWLNPGNLRTHRLRVTCGTSLAGQLARKLQHNPRPLSFFFGPGFTLFDLLSR
jgi:hypothetical protein